MQATTMSVREAVGLGEEGVGADSPVVGEGQEDSAGGSEGAIADGDLRRSHESPEGERQEEMKGSHMESLAAPPVAEVREKIVERVVVEEKVRTQARRRGRRVKNMPHMYE